LLRAAGQTAISLVAMSDGRLADHVLFSTVSLVPAQTRLLGLGLAPLAVLPEFQEQGIGSQLVLRGRQVGREATFDFAFVLGDPNYYARFSFRRARDFHLVNEYGADESFRMIELRPSA
jgi:putative acetyltransferase